MPARPHVSPIDDPPQKTDLDSTSPPETAAGGNEGGQLDLRGRVALRPAEAARSMGISPRTLAQMLADRRCTLPRTKIGGVVLLPVDGLRAWIAEQAAEAARERGAT